MLYIVEFSKNVEFCRKMLHIVSNNVEYCPILSNNAEHCRMMSNIVKECCGPVWKDLLYICKVLKNRKMITAIYQITNSLNMSNLDDGKLLSIILTGSRI